MSGKRRIIAGIAFLALVCAILYIVVGGKVDETQEFVRMETIKVSLPSIQISDTLSVTSVDSLAGMEENPFTPENIDEAISEYVDTPDGALPWRLFSMTKSTEEKGVDSRGYDYLTLHPEFSDGLKKHDGKQVTIKGFMFPLQPSEKQEEFLFGPFPVSCPYHYHVPNTLVIEVHVREPQKFTFEALTLTGRLELLIEDEFNMFYKLHDAVVIH